MIIRENTDVHFRRTLFSIYVTAIICSVGSMLFLVCGLYFVTNATDMDGVLAGVIFLFIAGFSTILSLAYILNGRRCRVSLLNDKVEWVDALVRGSIAYVDIFQIVRKFDDIEIYFSSNRSMERATISETQFADVRESKEFSVELRARVKLATQQTQIVETSVKSD